MVLCALFCGVPSAAVELIKCFPYVNKIDSMGGVQACKTEACAIQTCLSKSHYQSEQCQKQIQDLMKCCEKYQVCLTHRFAA